MSLGLLNIPMVLLTMLVAGAAIWLFIAALLGISRSSGTGTEKAVWVLVVLCFPFVGALVWFVIGANSAGGRTERW